MKNQKTKMGCCFLPDTNVKLPGGITKISSIIVGQEVIGYDIVKSEFATGRVMRVDIDCEPLIIKIRFSDKDELITTPSQRFWQGCEWFLAGNLKPGMTLSGKLCNSVLVEKWQKDVFTLVVEPLNNYKVLSRCGAEFIAHDNSTDFGYPPDLVVGEQVAIPSVTD